jgi:hypothetical protein
VLEARTLLEIDHLRQAENTSFLLLPRDEWILKLSVPMVRPARKISKTPSSSTFARRGFPRVSCAKVARPQARIPAKSGASRVVEGFKAGLFSAQKTLRRKIWSATSRGSRPSVETLYSARR